MLLALINYHHFRYYFEDNRPYSAYPSHSATPSTQPDPPSHPAYIQKNSESPTFAARVRVT